MLKLRNIVLIVLLGVVGCLTAQVNGVPQQPDSVKILAKDSTVVLQSDSVTIEAPKVVLISTDTVQAAVSKALGLEPKTFKPDPKKAVIYSAIFPGLGQIYNRKFWKLPIVYGGFVGFAYAISWNNGYYQDYFQAQKAILDDDPANDSVWGSLLPYGQTIETVDKQWFSGVLKDRKDYFRYYRDFSIILAVAWYGLTIVDAYVDAQLFEFDVSPDLSLRVEPAILKKTDMNFLANSNSYGFKFSFSF